MAKMSIDRQIVVRATRALVAFFALFLWVACSARAPVSIPAVPPGRSFEWDISNKNSVIQKDIIVTEYRFYELLLEFHSSSQPKTAAEYEQLVKFTGDGSFRVYTKDPVNPLPVIPKTSAEVQRMYELVRTGEYILKPANPGVVVPIHVTVEMFGGTSDNIAMSIADETIDTISIIAGGRRLIKTVKLKPGKYRLTAETIKANSLPPNFTTFLGVSFRANTVVIKDNE
jgi:hypothetical protein